MGSSREIVILAVAAVMAGSASSVDATVTETSTAVTAITVDGNEITRSDPSSPQDSHSSQAADVVVVERHEFTGSENAIYAPDPNNVFVAYKRFSQAPASGQNIPAQLRVARSSDGGDTWDVGVADPVAPERGELHDHSIGIDGVDESNVFVVYGNKHSNLFADWKLKLARTNDAGKTWTTSVISESNSADSVDIEVVDHRRIFVTARASGGSAPGFVMFRSSDGGATWTRQVLDAGAIGKGFYGSLGTAGMTPSADEFCDPATGAGCGRIFAAHYLSLIPNTGTRVLTGGEEDDFATWTISDVEQSNVPTRLVGIGSSLDAADRDNAYVAYEDDSGFISSMKVAYTRDGGQTWQPREIEFAREIGRSTSMVAIDPETAYVAYWRANDLSSALQTEVRVAHTSDGGETWDIRVVPQHLTQSGRTHLDLAAPTADTQYVSFIGDDRLNTTALKVARFRPGLPIPSPHPTDLLPLPPLDSPSPSGSPTPTPQPDAEVVVADRDDFTGYENSIYSPDPNNLFVAYKRFTVNPTSAEYAPAELRMAVSRDRGVSWETRVIDAAPERGAVFERAVAMDGVGTSRLFIAYLSRTSGAFADAKLMFARSTDGGSTWTTTLISTLIMGMIDVDAFDANTIFVTARGESAQRGLNVFKSVDGGQTWALHLADTELGSGLYTGVAAADMASPGSCSPISGEGCGRLFVGHYHGLLGNTHPRVAIGSQQDDFATWKSKVVESPTTETNRFRGVGASADSVDQEALFVAYEDILGNSGTMKVASSTDAGESWTVVPVDTGPVAGANTSTEALDRDHIHVAYLYRAPQGEPGDDGQVRVASTDDAGATWQVAIPPGQSSLYLDLAAPSDTVRYVSFRGEEEPDGAQVLKVARLGDAVDPDPTASATTTAEPSATPSPVPEDTSLSFTERSARSGQYSDETLFEARLTDSDDDPIAGAELSFELDGDYSTRSFSATTDEYGVASVVPILSERPALYQLTVRFTGDNELAASLATTTFVVDKEDSELALTVDGRGRNTTLQAHLTDLDSPTIGVAGRTIDFYSDGEPIGSAQTDPAGRATITVPPRYRGANRTYEAVFSGDDLYRGSSDRGDNRGGGKRSGTQDDGATGRTIAA